jgi:hypothetical protein
VIVECRPLESACFASIGQASSAANSTVDLLSLLLPSPRDIRAYNIITEDTSYPLASQPSTYFSTPHSHILRVIKYANSRCNHFSQQFCPLQIVPPSEREISTPASPQFRLLFRPTRLNSIIHSILRLLLASCSFRVSHPLDLLNDVVYRPYWVDSGMTGRATATSVLHRVLPVRNKVIPTNFAPDAARPI